MLLGKIGSGWWLDQRNWDGEGMDYVGIKASNLFCDKKLYWWQVILDGEQPNRSVRSKYLSARWGTRSFASEQGSASSGEKWERRAEFIGWTCMCVCVFLTNMFWVKKGSEILHLLLWWSRARGPVCEIPIAPVALMLSGSYLLLTLNLMVSWLLSLLIGVGEF